MISALLGQLWPYIAGAVALLLGFLGLRAKWRSEGREQVRQANAAEREEAATARREVDDEVRRTDDAAVRDGLREWTARDRRD